MRAERRGFTLLEMLVVCVLFGILGTLLASILVPMMKASQKGTDSSDLRQMGATALELMTEDIEQTSGAGVALLGNELSVQQVLGINSDGGTLWNRTCTVYSWNAGELRSFISPVVSQSQPYRWAPAALATLLSSGTSHLLATDVQQLQLTGISNFGIKPPLLLSLTLSRATGSVVVQQAASPALKNASR